LLALHDATRQLADEFSEEPQEDVEMDLAGDALTRSQQVLIVYYIGRLLDIYHDKKVTKCAKALHAFLRVPYSELPNFELYKKLLHPLSKRPSTLQNLKVVRSFFEDLDLKSALNLIDDDMQRISGQNR
jgi:hypothetical protein